ncbi:MAG: DUF362 domain-containing protein [Candidatus Scalindua sp.]|nr:DUF362 domain-containing protein [Candidatus Scalindua sp.]MCR4343417.1 DUF362 domain-containing protein [Candidatus Scalindua sp.]
MNNNKNRKNHQQLLLFPDKTLQPVWLKHADSKILLERMFSIDDCKGFIVKYLKSCPGTLERISSASAILVKPNITTGEPPENGRTTNPLVIKALFDALSTFGISHAKIIVADSSVIGIDTLNAARVTGILEICEKYNIHFMDLNCGPFINQNVDHHLQNQVIPIHELGLREDVFKINVGKIKTTYGSPVGFCIKNLKGMVPSETKLSFHLNGVQDSLVDLRKVLTCDLNILEGFPASELGKPKECNIIGISDNDILLDSIVSDIIGIPFSQVPHLRLLVEEKELTISNLQNYDKINIFRNILPKFKFAVHGVNDLAKEYGINIIDGKSCTACLESFYKAIDKLTKKNLIPHNYNYVMGLWHVNTKWESYKKNPFIFVGKCALTSPQFNKYIDKAHQESSKEKESTCDKDVVIPGCPPTIDSMVSTLKELNLSSSRNLDTTNTGPLSDSDISLKSFSQPSPLIKKWIQVLPLVNALTSSRIGKIIDIMPKEKVDFIDLGEKVSAQCEMVTAAICHQINWDFLRNKIKEEALKDPECWDFNRLKHFSKKNVEELLSGYPKEERIRAIERAKMLRELPKLAQNFQFSFFDILKQTGFHLGGVNGLLSKLQQVSVFSEDPEMKKAQVLVHSLYRAKLWKCKDEQNIRPAIDYHIMRLYIRRGNVWPQTIEGESYLRENIRRRPSTTSAIRTLIADAMKAITFYKDYSIVDVNGAEWWIGRAVCHRESPDCFLKNRENTWLLEKFSECPYKRNCYAWTRDQALLKTQEPREESKFY